jgi:hypothetical protein
MSESPAVPLQQCLYGINAITALLGCGLFGIVIWWLTTPFGIVLWRLSERGILLTFLFCVLLWAVTTLGIYTRTPRPDDFVVLNVLVVMFGHDYNDAFIWVQTKNNKGCLGGSIARCLLMRRKPNWILISYCVAVVLLVVVAGT